MFIELTDRKGDKIFINSDKISTFKYNTLTNNTDIRYSGFDRFEEINVREKPQEIMAKVNKTLYPLPTNMK